ncbi:FmdB family zinc ribbon protein [Actinacidiphila alni]|uniref:FmdB family zinc ribbon protein n=1 Tax=Actinacidiphila alni TaxID=380248 RepID=UPI000A8D5DA7|nr:zinc ribbon domain-containing protein [Actinacidiphila alni]
MPRYEYRCKSCGSTFELRRPMSQANAPTVCPKGHDDTVKLLSTVAVATSSSSSSAPSASSGPAPAGGGGGCCGGGCCS